MGCWALRQGRLSDEDLPKVLILLASFGDDVTDHTLKLTILNCIVYQNIFDSSKSKYMNSKGPTVFQRSALLKQFPCFGIMVKFDSQKFTA